MKQKLLLAMALLLPLILGEVQAQKSLPSKHGFGQNRNSANAREVQSATTAQTPSRRSVLRAPSTDVQAPTGVAASGITGASATVSWNGTGDSYNLRYRKILQSEGFESCSQGQLPAGWTALDADGDGHSWITWDYTRNPYDYYGNPQSFNGKSVESASYDDKTGALTPDNWLISPQVPLKGELSLWARAQDPDYVAEHFAIYLSTTGKDVADFTVLIPETVAQGVFTEYTADLSAYAGQVGYIAIRHFDVTDMFRLGVDNITFTDDWVEADGVTSPYTLDGLDGLSIYEVEVQAVTGEKQSSWSSTLRFKTLPTNATLLYQQDFDNTNDINELGWTFVDNDGNGRNWTMSINGKYDNHEFSPLETSTSFPNSLYSLSFTDDGRSTINADNWAITPAIEIDESSILSFQLAYADVNTPDKVGVYVGETANVNEMSEVLAPKIFSRTAKHQFNEETVDLSAFAGKTCYIAFRHQDKAKYAVLIDDVTVYTTATNYTTATKYDLTLADGSDDHGTVAFTVDGATATQAKKDDVVTVSVTPNEGYSAKDVTVRAYTSWGAAGAPRRSAPALVSDINVTKQENGTWSFTMPEANVWVTVTYAKNLQDAWIEAIADQTYTGSAIEPTIEVKDGETTLTLNTDYTVAYSNNTNAGEATVTVTAVEGSDYSGTATATFAIQNADITMTTTPAAVSGLVYSGEAQTLITAGTASFGTVLYSLDGTNFSDALPQGTDAGTYTVTYKVEGDDNHNAFAAQTLDVTIATNKTELNNAITEAEAYYNSISESNPDAAAALQTAINTAKGVKDNADATQSEIESAAQTLNEAVDAAKADVALKRITLVIPAKSYMARIDADKRQIENAVDGVKLYSVKSVTNTEVELTGELSVIAAEMPYFIYNDNDTEVEVSIIVSSEDADNVDYDSDHFKGTLVDKTFTDEDMQAADHYVLTGHNFVWVKDAGTLAAGKCWIELEKSPANARALSIVFEDETTGISAVKTAATIEGNCYDLSGRKVAQPTKGLFIVNGKKVVIK